VRLESPNQAEVISLIAELDAYQDKLYPAEARYALDLTALEQTNVLFTVAREIDGTAVGCGAFGDYAEHPLSVFMKKELK
jgi:putative acetyltransferase